MVAHPRRAFNFGRFESKAKHGCRNLEAISGDLTRRSARLSSSSLDRAGRRSTKAKRSHSTRICRLLLSHLLSLARERNHVFSSRIAAHIREPFSDKFVTSLYYYIQCIIIYNIIIIYTIYTILLYTMYYYIQYIIIHNIFFSFYYQTDLRYNYDVIFIKCSLYKLNKRHALIRTTYCWCNVFFNVIIFCPCRNKPKTFAFDHCFYSLDPGVDNFASQNIVFDALGRDILDNAFQGYNACIFAYGQTGMISFPFGYCYNSEL